MISPYCFIESPFSIRLTKKLKKIARIARDRCETRKNEFILNAKSEINLLVRKRLTEIQSLIECQKLLERDDENEEDPFGAIGDSDSETSDPLGMMASTMFDEDSESNNDKPESALTLPHPNDRRSSSAHRATVKAAKFSKFNVLASIEGIIVLHVFSFSSDDINRSQSQTEIAVTTHPRWWYRMFGCCY